MTLGIPIVLATAGVLTAAMAAVVAITLGRSAEAPLAALDPARQRVLLLPIFTGLPAARLEAAATLMRDVHVAPGDVVIRQGDQPDNFYVIVAGQFEVTDSTAGGSRSLRTLGPDDAFGEIGLLTGKPRSATVTATSAGHLLALDGDQLLGLVGAGPSFGPRLLSLYRGASSRGD